MFLSRLLYSVSVCRRNCDEIDQDSAWAKTLMEKILVDCTNLKFLDANDKVYESFHGKKTKTNRQKTKGLDNSFYFGNNTSPSAARLAQVVNVKHTTRLSAY